MDAVISRDEDGTLVRKAGVMAIVVLGGEVQPGDSIQGELPPPPRQPFEPV